MEPGHATGLIHAIQAYRKVYEHENQHLSEWEREHGWKQQWNSISAEVTGELGLHEPPKVTPMKRPASNSLVGTEPASKRPGFVGTPMRCLALPD